MEVIPGKKVVVVGSRRCSEYGVAVTKDIVGRLAARGFVIVSGLAVGIDTLAHEAAIEVNGKTIGVLGYGFGFLKHDKENSILIRKLTQSGNKVFSPFKKFQKPTRSAFVYRNKKMVEMCDAVIVIEATIEGGSMLTAQLAMEAGKPVFAVPGSIFNYTSQGTNLLIKNGAIPLTSADDVVL